MIPQYQILIDLATKNNGTVRTDDPALKQALGDQFYRLSTYVGDVRRKTSYTVTPIKQGRATVAYFFPELFCGIVGTDGLPAGTVSAPAVSPTAPRAPRAPRAPKAVATVEPVTAAAPLVNELSEVPTVDTVTATSGLSLAVSKSDSVRDITARIDALTSQASLLARVPSSAKEFVPFGDFDAVRQVIKSHLFCPIFITGHSGNGKTFQIEQACAMERREYVRVNITTETDEDDLIGGFRLKDGETVFELGPVVVAMLRGAVLLLDEVDLAGPKVMCLQPVLEGKPLTIKKLGITVSPVRGFTVFATANTKGRGSDDGKYIGTNLLNEAFLERFNFTIEQQYPSVAVEKKILLKHFDSLGQTPTETEKAFFETLAKWADMIRQTFNADGIEDLISTRRLCHIVKTYAIFRDEERALALCLNRFDASVKAQFLDFYQKLNPVGSGDSTTPTAETVTPTEDTVTSASVIGGNTPPRW